MTSCSTNTCGIGGWGGPLPGDPNNNSVLTASPAFGGIDVSWTYPTTNPAAVAHVLLYRGNSSNFNTAVLLATVGGNFFYDKSTSTQIVEYFYWIKIVSVNSTVGALIGPASAIAKPPIASVIEGLTAQIDSGFLAQSLKTEIDKITLNYQDLLDEVNNRIAANTALSTALGQVQTGVTQSLTFINTEITQRQAGDSALVSQLNTVAAANTSNLALIQQEALARVGGDDANAALYTTLNSQVNNETTGLPATRATLINDYYTKAGTDSAISSATTALVSTTALNTALGEYTTTAALQNGYYTKTQADTAISTSSTTLSASVLLTAATDATTKATAAKEAAEAYAAAQAIAAEIAANAYADGIVTAEEARAIADATAKANAAKDAAVSVASADATAKADAAKAAADIYAEEQATLAEVTAKAYADGIVTAEETRAIADATAKAEAARVAAVTTAAADATAKANAAKTGAETTATSLVRTIETGQIGYAVLTGTSKAFDGDGTTVVYPVSLYPAVDYPQYAIDRTRIIDKVGVTRWNATTVGQAKLLDWLVGLPIASAVKTLQITDGNGNTASLETAFNTQKTLNDGLKAEYTAKLSVDGLIGGFGVYNDGASVQAGFDVDEFWVGKTQANKRKPFIISGGIVYIDSAAINDAAITTAKIADAQISTLKIAGSAVTVPSSLNYPKTSTGMLIDSHIISSALGARQYVFKQLSSPFVTATGYTSSILTTTPVYISAVIQAAEHYQYANSAMRVKLFRFEYTISGTILTTYTVDSNGEVTITSNGENLYTVDLNLQNILTSPTVPLSFLASRTFAWTDTSTKAADRLHIYLIGICPIETGIASQLQSITSYCTGVKR
jgi:hypothetical protein